MQNVSGNLQMIVYKWKETVQDWRWWGWHCIHKECDTSDGSALIQPGLSQACLTVKDPDEMHEWGAHPTEPGIAVTSCVGFSFCTNNMGTGKGRKDLKTENSAQSIH